MKNSEYNANKQLANNRPKDGLLNARKPSVFNVVDLPLTSIKYGDINDSKSWVLIDKVG